MNQICIICVYFGKFPSNFEIWYDSCLKNEKIDFLLITDQNGYKQNQNIHFIYMTMNEFKNLIIKKIGIDVKLENPRKCCDYKPAYGVILQDYLHQYSYWGSCDMDLVFGDITSFLEKYSYQDYDKFLPLGHLTLYRNTLENNERYKLKCSTEDYIEAFSTDDNMIFDERSICNIYDEYNFPVFKKRIFADISPRNKRFLLGGKDINYKEQIFIYDKGKVFRIYFFNNKMYKEEYLYIHFQNRSKMKDNTNGKHDNYIISYAGFYPLINEDYKMLIQKFNRYQGYIYEKLELKVAWIKRRKKNLIKRIKKIRNQNGNK